MFCPQWRAEYREGFTHCNDCNVLLVFSSPLESAELPQGASELLYESNNEVEFVSVMAALQEACIEFFETVQSAGFLYPSVLLPRYRIWIAAADREHADDVLTELLGEQEGDEEVEPLADEELGSPAGADEEASTGSIEHLIEWDPEEATSEVWRGNDNTVARFVAETLREHGLRQRTQTNLHDETSVLVHPDDEARAVEIVREICDWPSTE